MDTTVRFYHGVLGMRVVASLSAGPMRHYFFEIGPQNTLAFFEWSGSEVDTESIAKPAGIPPTFPAQFDHLSFNLPDEQALIDLQDRLRAHDVEVTEVVDHSIMRSIYFTDPNGIALEASWWVIDPTGRDAAYDGTAGLFTDARSRARGSASWPPTASWPGPRPPVWWTPGPTPPEPTRPGRQVRTSTVRSCRPVVVQRVDQAMTRFLNPAMPRHVSTPMKATMTG